MRWRVNAAVISAASLVWRLNRAVSTGKDGVKALAGTAVNLLLISNACWLCRRWHCVAEVSVVSALRGSS